MVLVAFAFVFCVCVSVCLKKLNGEAYISAEFILASFFRSVRSDIVCFCVFVEGCSENSLFLVVVFFFVEEDEEE
jgi:hypothetical protein